MSTTATTTQNTRSARGRRIVRYPQLRELFGISYSYSWLIRLERAGKWPRRVRIGPGCVGWFESEIEDLIADCDAARTRGR